MRQEYHNSPIYRTQCWLGSASAYNWKSVCKNIHVKFFIFRRGPLQFTCSRFTFSSYAVLFKVCPWVPYPKQQIRDALFQETNRLRHTHELIMYYFWPPLIHQTLPHIIWICWVLSSFYTRIIELEKSWDSQQTTKLQSLGSFFYRKLSSVL